MHTFLQITQAIINLPYPEKIPIRHLDGSLDNVFAFLKEQFENEKKLPTDQRRSIIKQFFILFALANKGGTKEKYKFFKETIENIFINDEMRETFLVLFTKMQRTYHALSKFAFICKHKITPVLINTDMYLYPLDPKHPRVFSLIQNNKKYLFSITDLINILNSSLGNTFYFVSEPLVCKNPYINSPFTKAMLYNIYFFIKRAGFIIPNLIHQYFLTNFNLCVFGQENEDLIRDYSIKQYVNNADVDELYSEIKNMLNYDMNTKKIKVNKNFPRDRLVNIMRPYLELYYKGTYCMNESKRDRYIDEFDYKIIRFHEYNKQFGRKYMSPVVSKEPFLFNQHKYTMSFDDKHVPFVDNKYKDDFETSHMHIIEMPSRHIV
jgi:hypothetical protein